MSFTYKGFDDVHRCQVCGTEYHACNDCIKGTPLQYREVCDTIAHFEVQQAVAQFCGGTLNRKEAIAELKKCDISDIDSWKIEIQVIVRDLLGLLPEVKKTESEKT